MPSLVSDLGDGHTAESAVGLAGTRNGQSNGTNGHSNGANGYSNGVNGNGSRKDVQAEIDAYIVREEPLYQQRPLKVVCIGAGVSGLASAIKVQETLTDIDFTIYEKNADVGGTWLENRYPGCACDVPAHAYAYTFEPNPDYSRYYVGSVEIHEYLRAVTKKYHLEKYIKYNHKLVSAVWNEDEGEWTIGLEIAVLDSPERSRYFETKCHVLLNAGGLLNNWKWPAISGLESFEGPLLHSARWDSSIDFKDKVVAIIGSGSSAIQIVPQLQPVVKHMKSFIRSPTWIAPSLGFVDPKNEGPKNFHYTEEEKAEFRRDPEGFLAYRKKIESDMNRTFETYLRQSDKQKEALVEFAKLMKNRLGGDERLSASMIPKYGVGCRRLTPGQNFLETLIKDNVTVITEDIERIDPKGIVTKDGVLHEVEAIICATGFDTTYRPRFKLIGRNGANLADEWKDTNDIESYLAMAVPQFPNYFTFLGPNSPISNGTLIPVEKQAEYMIKFIKKMQSQCIKSVCVKAEAAHQLNIHHQKFLQRMVFSEGCRSWYKGGRADGKVIGIWPGSSLHYYETIETPRFEDFDYTYEHGNAFEFLGNGWTSRELRDKESGGAEDLAYYLVKPADVLCAPGS